MTPGTATHSKDLLCFLAVLALVGTAFLVSLCVGAYPIPLTELIGLVSGKAVNPTARSVFFTLRLPRTFMAAAAGFGLSLSGSVFQTVFRNPLASPDLIGVASGASMGAAYAIVFWGGGMAAVSMSAFAGGMLAAVLLLGLVGLSRRRGMATFVLAGIVLNTLAQAAVMTVKFLADPERQLSTIEFWTMGSFSNVTAGKVRAILPILLAGTLGLYLLRRQTTLLSLDEDESRMLGVRTTLVRYGVLLCATLLVSGIVCVSGLIGFVGLIAPHIGRMLLKRNNFDTAVFSGLVGAALLLAADCLARTCSAGELPVSILTSALGAPFLAYLLIRRGDTL